MYRKPSGSIGFSYTQFINAAVPPIIGNPAGDPGSISMHSKDTVYAHQIFSQNKYAFDERTLFVSGILDNEGVSKKAFRKLQKAQILSDAGIVDTRHIGPTFTHQMAIIGALRQKYIIDLLFWWEEECHRLRKLDAEQVELETLVAEQKRSLDRGLDGSGEDDSGSKKQLLDELGLLLERVKMKIRQLPSQRRDDIETDRDDILVGSSRERRPGNEPPPGYWP